MPWQIPLDVPERFNVLVVSIPALTVSNCVYPEETSADSSRVAKVGLGYAKVSSLRVLLTQ